MAGKLLYRFELLEVGRRREVGLNRRTAVVVDAAYKKGEGEDVALRRAS